MRTLLSTLGIVMGAASLVGVLSVGDGAQILARQQIERAGLQAVGVLPKTADVVDGLNIPRTNYPTFTIAHAKALSAYLGPGPAVALTSAGMGTFALAPGGAQRATTVNGVYGSADALLGSLGVLHGRFLTPDEMTDGTTVAVVSNNLAHELAGSKPLVRVLNMPLLLQGRAWTIVGVLDEYPNARTFAVFVPIGSLPLATLPAAAAPQATRPPSLLVHAPRIEDVLPMQAQVEAWADATNPRWRKDGDITIASQGIDRLRQVNQAMLIFKMLLGSFAAISLVVGGIGIMNVLLAAVAERTREIGVRKATGATRSDIVAQFLSESVAISLAGALIGAIVGLAASMTIAAVIRWRAAAPLYAAFTWQTLAVSTGTAIAIGLIFGVYPALKAARLSPVDAMRYE